MNLYESQSVELTIAEGCPWHEAQVKYGTPNVDWCEPTVCSYINEPANTWSNLGFLIAGLLIVKKLQNLITTAFGWIVIVMGLFSAIYHATNNYLSQHLDFLGMALMTSYLLAFAVVRLRSQLQERWTWYWFFVSLNLGTLLFLGILKWPVQLLLALNAIPIVILELILFFRRSSRLKMTYFWLSIVLLVIAQVSAQIDLKRVYCQPESLFFHGHVLWHILCAVAMYFAALHMREHSPTKA